MNREELLRKRNIELTKQIDDLKRKLAMSENLNDESRKKSTEIIVELEKIKTSWLEALDEINEQKGIYEELIKELKAFKNSVKGRNAIERWFYDLKKK